MPHRNNICAEKLLAGEYLGLDIFRNADLIMHNSMRLPAKAAYLIIAHAIEELSAAIEFSRGVRLPFMVLGGGTNVIFGTENIQAVMIKLGKEFDYIKRVPDSTLLEVGAGTPLAKVVDFALQNQIAGFANFWGIPGTIGGAIAGNAGAARQSICQLLVQATVLSSYGEFEILNGNDIQWGYRFCNLQGRTLVSAQLQSQPAKEEETVETLQEIKQRRAKHPHLAAEPSAGCIFKNLPDKSAGLLIEAAGLKGTSIGGATVSEKHANFIVNRHAAKPEDVLALIKLVQVRVKAAFGIWLEPEVRIIDMDFLNAGAKA